MLVVVACAFPLILLVAALLMEQVERPLRPARAGLEPEQFLDAAEVDLRPEDLTTFVTEGYEAAAAKIRRRRFRDRLSRGAKRGRAARAAAEAEARQPG